MRLREENSTSEPIWAQLFAAAVERAFREVAVGNPVHAEMPEVPPQFTPGCEDEAGRCAYHLQLVQVCLLLRQDFRSLRLRNSLSTPGIMEHQRSEF